MKENKEQKWLKFMDRWLKENGSIPLKEAINSGAYVADASSLSTQRYLQKHASAVGRFMVIIDADYVKRVVVRDQHKSHL